MAKVKTKVSQSNPSKEIESRPSAAHDLREARRIIDSLQQQLQNVNLQNEERENLRAEFYQLWSKIDNVEKATPPALAKDKVVVRWCDTHKEECRRASVVIPDTWDDAIIFAKGDEQLGHSTCDEARVKKDLLWVESNPHCLMFLLGDAIDSATKTSPGSIRENPTTPLRQVENYIALHKSVQERIIGYVGGNHERRIDKALDDPGAAVRLIAKGLSTEDHKLPYSSAILLIDVYWKGHLWTFTLFHGAGAAQTPGSKIQRMQRNMMLTDSAITLSGHLHDEAKTSRRFIRRKKDKTISIAKQTSLQCGSYLKYVGSYGEVGGMSPTGPDMIVIELLPDGNYTDRFKGAGD